MPKFKRFQNSFLGGEIDPEFIMRGDAESANQSCRKARNVALLTGGGAIRRPGSALLVKTSNKRRLRFFRASDGNVYCLAIEASNSYVLDLAGAVIDSAASPWGVGILDTISLVNASDGVYVFSSGFTPRFISFDGTNMSVDTITFSAGVGGTSQRPYFRYAPKGVTLTVSATSGTPTIQFSDDVLVAAHVGVKFRIAGREITIATVVDGQNGTATVNQLLYPTYDVPVTTSGGFAVGQIVEGADTKFRGEVIAINSGTSIKVLMLNSYQEFYHDSVDPTLSEKIIGPSGQAQVTGTSSVATPAPALEWDEQMLSSARGFPSTGVVHRNRLVMAGFPQAREYIAASAVGQYDNFDTRQYDTLGADAADAFIEGIGLDDVSILHLASLENLMCLTDRGIYYVPEFEINFAPGEIKFLRLSPEASSAAEPAVVTEGLVYADASGGKIMAVIPTGLVNRPWEVRELSQAASHLINNPIGIYATSTVGARKHRIILVLNADGTIATLSYLRFENFAGWTLWSRAGVTCTSLAVDQGTVFVQWHNGSTYPLCIFDWSKTLDEEVSYASAATLHASKTVILAWDGHYTGSYTLNGSGLISTVTPASGLSVGFDFLVELEPFPPFDAERGRAPVGVSEIWCHVYQSGAFKADGEYWSPYRPKDSLFDPPPNYTGDVEFKLYDQYGDSFLRAPLITQDECAPLHVQAITMKGRF